MQINLPLYSFVRIFPSSQGLCQRVCGSSLTHATSADKARWKQRSAVAPHCHRHFLEKSFSWKTEALFFAVNPPCLFGPMVLRRFVGSVENLAWLHVSYQNLEFRPIQVLPWISLGELRKAVRGIKSVAACFFCFLQLGSLGSLGSLESLGSLVGLHVSIYGARP